MLQIKKGVPSLVKDATEDFAICDIGGFADLSDTVSKANREEVCGGHF